MERSPIVQAPSFQVRWFKAVEVGTSFARSTVAGVDGQYVLPNLRPTQYELTAEMSGFRAFRRSGVELLANQSLTINAGDRQAGLYPNLFDAHPPFQIDGNFGATAGIAEMLMQSHNPHARPLDAAQMAGSIHLLPALPSAFPSGKVTGLRARGGLEVSLEWRDGKLVRVDITATRTNPLTVRYAGKEVQIQARAGRSYQLDSSLNIRKLLL